jgi:GNAT superfamily N-acetyltransferase
MNSLNKSKIIKYDSGKEWMDRAIYKLADQFNFYRSNLLLVLKNIPITPEISEFMFDETFDKNFQGSGFTKTKEFLKMFHDMTLTKRKSQSNLEGYLYVKDLKEVGFILYTKNIFHTDLDYIFVRPEHRTQGIGRELMNLVLNEEEIFKIETTNINFFKYFGFEYFSDSTLKDHVKMIKASEE